MTRLHRAQGCLLGQLAGDSLGSLVEFRDAADIAREYPHGVRELADGGTWNILAGQPTDDSEMALVLARALARDGEYDAAAARAAYVWWARSGPFDMGNATRAALLGAGPDPRSKANGSVMRLAPLGIFAAGRAREGAAWARVDSAITHPNPVCVDASAVFVRALATAIDGGDAYAAALDEATHPEIEAALRAAPAGPPADFMTHMGLVTIALQNAFHQLLRGADPEHALVATVGCGGDTDTNGAIAGALLGAVHGLEKIPKRWRETVLTCRGRRPPQLHAHDALELAATLLTRW